MVPRNRHYIIRWQVPGGGWEKAFNLDGLSLLYWLRFLNALLILPLVLARAGWPPARFSRKTLLCRSWCQPSIAFLPQTTFYAVNNDILSPLTFGAAFVLLLTFWEAEIPGPGIAAATGLALAATFLTKISNLPLAAVAGGFVGLKFFLMWWNGRLRATLVPLLVFLPCAALPMAAWMAWCRTNFGDLTGSAQKVQFLNWAAKPFGEWLHHPLFSSHGFWYFLKTNLATFWQGEQLWHRQPLADPAVNLACVVLTLGALALTLAALLRPRSGLHHAAAWGGGFRFPVLYSHVRFFALLSVRYDFQDCFYPSRALPYFTSGRLMLGMLIPFLILLRIGPGPAG